MMISVLYRMNLWWTGKTKLKLKRKGKDKEISQITFQLKLTGRNTHRPTSNS